MTSSPALDLLGDAIEPPPSLALQETVAEGIAGQPCDSTATARQRRTGG
jgi:hypothetical protein